ncbi:MAG: hypothetical protein ACI9SJ_001032 [Flavobacteriaceae bacterium]|jgi:hypothetical protein
MESDIRKNKTKKAVFISVFVLVVAIVLLNIVSFYFSNN